VAIVLPFVKRKAVKNRLPEILAGLAVFMVILILFHQKVAHGYWFKWADFWHHESIELYFVGLAIGMLFGKYLTRR
jgi:hypothetical protein